MGLGLINANNEVAILRKAIREMARDALATVEDYAHSFPPSHVLPDEESTVAHYIEQARTSLTRKKVRK